MDTMTAIPKSWATRYAAKWVELGAEVTDLKLGDRIALYTPYGAFCRIRACGCGSRLLCGGAG